MIVRTYSRRTRDIGRSFPDPALLGDAADPQSSQELPDFPLSQDGSQERFNFTAAFSSQDSSPWSLDPDPSADHNPSSSQRPGRKSRKARDSQSAEAAGPAVAATSTLMEAQEFGEMMEHVDEVNFAIDGLRPGQPGRIQRASLLSLLSICATARQRRLLRAQGMAKRIIDSILGLNFDDSPSTLAAATLFFVLASDVQDDHLLDSPPCINFLLKLLNPPTTDMIDGKAATIGSKLLGIRKPPVPSVTNKSMVSSSRTIISKVQEILLSCKEIQSGKWDDGLNRPELSSKWISLLTMEKACLSTVSFEDTSKMLRNGRGNFKERLRELGGLDSIFDVVVSCHSIMERWLKCRLPSISELKDGMESVVLLLKCLKILENATFLSKDNQDHLLGMRAKINSERLSMSFVGVVMSSIKVLSGLALLQRHSNTSNRGDSSCLDKNVDALFHHSSPVKTKETKRGNVACEGIEGSRKRNRTCHERQKLSPSLSELPDSGPEMIGSLGWEHISVKNKAERNGSHICAGASKGSNGDTYISTNCVKLNIKSNGFEMNVNTDQSTNHAIFDYSGKHERECGCIRATESFDPSETNSCRKSKRPHIYEDVKDECTTESFDPFAFDEGEFEPSKWDKLARKKETPMNIQSTVTSKECSKTYDDFGIGTDPILSQPTEGDSQKSSEDDCTSVGLDGSNLLEDCLLASVKVLMNLTNDNPIGCHQIASCGGLDTMVSLIISHFPSYDLCSPQHKQLNQDVTSSNQSTISCHMNNTQLTDHGLDFLVAILGLLVNLVEKDSRNRSRLASARISVEGPLISEIQEKYRDAIPLLCSIFLANQRAGEVAADLVSGITIASLAIPQGISYAKLANLPPILGLYSSFVPPLVYAMMGSSRDLAVGTVAVPSLLMASMLGREVSAINEPVLYLHLAFTATFFAGVFQLALGVLRLGFIVDFLSHATIVGFMGGAATVVCLQQLKGILGLEHFTTATDLVSVMESIFTQTHQWKWESVVLGVGFLFFLLSTRFLSKKRPKFFWVSAAAPLTSVVLGSILVYLTHAENHGVQVIGYLKRGLNPPSMTSLILSPPHMMIALKTGIITGIIALAEGIAVGRSFAMFKNYHIDGNKEMVAFGMMNMAGSFTSCYLTTGPFSRTAVNYNAGCKTAMSNVVMAAAVMVTLLFLTPLFHYTPLVVLAAIIISAMLGLIDYEAAAHLWQVDKVDFCVCVGAYFGVVFGSVVIGLVLAVAISILRVLLFVARPRTTALGNIPNSAIYRRVDQYPMALSVPGVFILQIDAPIYFANASYLRERISRWINDEEDRLRVKGDASSLQYVILDMGAVASIDTSGISMLEEVKKSVDMRGLQLVLANPGSEVMKKLDQSKILDKIGQEWIFLTVAEAVGACNFLFHTCKVGVVAGETANADGNV